MKIISPFVDHRDGKRYGPGDYAKIAPALDDAEIERLKSAGCLADGDDSDDPAKPPVDVATIPESRTAMRTEAGEAAHREADARARNKPQQQTAPKTAAKPALTLPDPVQGGDDGLAGRSKPPVIDQTK